MAKSKNAIDETKVTGVDKLLAPDAPLMPAASVPEVEAETEDAAPVDPFVELTDQVRFFVSHLAPNERGLALSLLQQMQELYETE